MCGNGMHIPTAAAVLIIAALFVKFKWAARQHDCLECIDGQIRLQAFTSNLCFNSMLCNVLIFSCSCWAQGMTNQWCGFDMWLALLEVGCVS
jgi:hypothetical protein